MNLGYTKVDYLRIKISDSKSARKTELIKVYFWAFAGVSFFHRNFGHYPRSKISKNRKSSEIDKRHCLWLSFSRWFRIWYFYSQIVDFSIPKLHYMVLLCIFRQYVLLDRPEDSFFATSSHSSFIALPNCYWCCKNGSGVYCE